MAENEDRAPRPVPRLFLSYNSADRPAVLRIQRLLEERQVSTFLDCKDLQTGMPWVPALEDGLRQVSGVAIFLGPTGLGTWQRRELWWALDRQARAEAAGQRFPVIPVLLPDTKLDALPGFLMLNMWVDLRGSQEDAEAVARLAQALEGKPADAPAAPAVASTLCPYRGLHAFREEDSPLFFGREDSANELFRKVVVDRARLVAVVGPSGSGKSSVVQAGLLPLLRRTRPPQASWDAVTFKPGRHPFRNLAASLIPLLEPQLSTTEQLVQLGELAERLGAGLEAAGERKVLLSEVLTRALKANPGTDRLLLVVDQFEELFTLAPESTRQPFLESLLEATVAAEATVLLTLRADYYGQAIGSHRGLSDLLRDGQVPLGPMLPEELKRVIAKPAERLGVHFEPGLVERILKDVEREPGGLPLLEFTLTRLWQAQEAGVIRNDKYQDDTLKQSISNRADELLARLTSGERELAMRGMTRLVRVVDASEEGSDTRQRVRLSQLGEATRRALEPFVEARLLVVDRHLATGEETIEVAHEALLRTWTALSKRLGQEREFLLWRQGLGPFLETWQQAPQKSEALLPGFRLEEAGGYLKSREQDLNEDERTFVRESLRRKKASRRARAWVLGLGGGLAGTALVAAVSYWGWTRSEGYQLREMARFPVDAVASDPKQDSAVLPWVEVLIQVGKPREALEAAFKLKSTVRRGDALFLAAKQLSLAGDTEAARRALEAALPFTVALEDMHGEAITEVVRRLASSNKPVALEFMSPWLKKENAWQGVAFHLAEARGLMRSGDTVRAREALDKAITRLRNAADAQLWNDIIIQGELLPTLGATASELGHQAPLKTALLYAAGRIPTPKRTQGGITALLSLARGLAALGEYTSSSDLLQKTLHDTQGWSSLESDWVRQTVEQGARAGESAPLLSLARTIKSSRFALDIAIGLLRAGKNEGVAALLDELEVLRKPAEYPFFEDADSLVGAIHALAKGGARDKARELLPNAIARCVSAGVGQLWTSTEEEVVWTVLELEEVEQVLMYTNMHIGSLKWGAFDEDTPKIDDPAWLLREALVQLARAGKADEALRSGERIGNTLVRAAVRARIAVVMAKQGRAQEASVLLRESLKELGKPEYSNEDVADAKNAFLHELASGLVEVGAIDEARESLRVMNAYDRSAGRAALMEALTQKVGPRDAFKFLTEEAALDDVIYSKALADFISAASKSDEARAALEVLPPDGWNKMHGDDRCRAGTELARWHARTGDIRSARLAVNQFCTQDDKVLQAYTTVLAEHVKRSRPAADGRTPD